MQLEILTLQEKYEQSVHGKNEIEKVLQNYQTAMEELVSKSQKKQQEQEKNLEKIAQEKRLVDVEL
jgi:tRNA G18 (ribose-2'-O)-methylase SpoU